MGKHTIWANGSPERDRLAPPIEKQILGWTTETPPHEWMNWHMWRTDSRLEKLEEPLGYVVLDLPSHKRTEIIRKDERFNLPVSYIVGTGQLHVYIDGLLCYPGEDMQYQECGEDFTESTYIRFNDDIDTEFDVRVEIVERARDESVSPDDLTSGQLNDLSARVAKLEEPLYSYRMDSPANTRTDVIRAGDIFTLEVDYLVGSGQLYVFRNGIMLYEGRDYDERGQLGKKSSEFTFREDIPVEDNIRAIVSIKMSDENMIVGNATSLKTLGEKVTQLTRELRIDTTIDTRIEALDDYIVPPYRVGTSELRVYKNGVLLTPNRDYTENTDDGEISSRIIWNSSVAEGSVITIITPNLSVLE